MDVKRAYLNYVQTAIAHFDPQYLLIGIEGNIMISRSPDLWTDYLDLHTYVYTNIRRDHPDLPIFAIVQYEHLRAAYEGDTAEQADRVGD